MSRLIRGELIKLRTTRTALGFTASGLIGHISKFTIGQAETSIAGDTGGEVLPWGAACLVLLAWTATFVLAATLVDHRRDIA